MAAIDKHTLSLTPGARIELYDFDMSSKDAGWLRFTSARESLTPANMFRFTDVTTALSSSIHTYLPEALSVGDRVYIEAFIRKDDPQTTMAWQLEPDGRGYVPANKVMFDLSQMDHTVIRIGASESASNSITIAHEFFYISSAFTITESFTNPTLTIYPSHNPTQSGNTANATSIGSLDMFGLQVFVEQEGVKRPIMFTRDLSKWELSAGITVPAEVPNSYEAVKVPVWQGNAYTPIPIQAEGFEKTGTGPFPRPRISISNITGAGSQFMQTYGDIRGLPVTRTRLYAESLDNGSDPDPSAFYAPDVFYINRRSREDGDILELELSSKMDQHGVLLPRRQILRDVCPWKYRSWVPDDSDSGGSFHYAGAEDGCPYTNAAMFDINGDAVTNPEEDKCSHQLTTGCRARYSTNEALPFGGFPMVGRFST